MITFFCRTRRGVCASFVFVAGVFTAPAGGAPRADAEARVFSDSYADVRTCTGEPQDEGATRLWSDLVPSEKTTQLNAISISGGGAYGAWGAGILCGWHERPQFDLVTGISTGALMATFVFLGRDFDHHLRNFYTNVTRGDILRPRPFFEIPFANSLNTLEPLKRILSRTLSDDVLSEVARRGNGTRQLAVGTVEVGTGKFCSWDLVKIASQGRYDLYRDVILASASAPFYTPPVAIGDELHMDGGVRSQVYTTALVENHRAWETKVKSVVGSSATVNTTIIVNGKLQLARREIPRGIIGILERTLAILLNESLNDDVRAIAQGRGLFAAANVSLLPIPDDFQLAAGAYDFNTEEMRRLFALGEEWLTDDDHGGAGPSEESPR